MNAPDTLPADTQMQNVTAPDTLPANTQMQGVQSPVTAPSLNAPTPNPFGLTENLKQGAQNVVESFKQLPGKLAKNAQQAGSEFESAAEQGNLFGEVGALGKGLFRGLGDIAISATSPITEGIGAGLNTAGNVPVLGTGIKGALTGGIEGVSDFISNSPIVQKFAMNHPQAEEDFNRALTLILLSAGGPKAVEQLPERGAVKEVATDLVKSPIQFTQGVKEIPGQVGAGAMKLGQKLLLPEAPPSVKTALGQMTTPQLDRLIQAAHENRINAGSLSPMEIVGQTALRDLKTIQNKLGSIGEQKSSIMQSAAGREKVGSIVTKFLQGFNTAVKEKAQLRGDESLVRDIQNQAKLVGPNPTAQAVDRFVDYVQERVYSGSRDLSIPQSDAVEQVARREVGKLNEALKNRMPEAYRTLNKKYSDMVKVRDDLNQAMGKGGERSANFIKTVFSPFSARVKGLLPKVQAITGNDLMSQAVAAKHVMDVMGMVAQKSLLENQTGLNKVPTSMTKAAFDFGVHKAQKFVGGEEAQLEAMRKMTQGYDASQAKNFQSTNMTTSGQNTVPRIEKKIDTATQNTTAINKSQSTAPKNTKVSMPGNVAQKSTNVKSDIGVTSFRGTPVKTIKETKPYFETPRAKGFEKSLKNTADDFGIKAQEVNRVAGAWEGSIEPSFSVKVSGTEADKLAYAVEHAKKANQDAVIMFTRNKEAKGTKDTFRVDNPDAALKQMKKIGIPGATIDGQYLSIYDADGSLRVQVEKLMVTKGFEHIDTVLGDVKLIFKDDYAKYER